MKNEVSAAAPVKWFLIAAIWSGVALFDATQTVVVMRAAGMHHAWVSLFALQWLNWLPWALATPVVMRAGARHPLTFRRAGSARAWGTHVVTWLAVNVAADVWMASLEHVLNPWNPGSPPGPFAGLLLQAAHDHAVSSLILYYCVLMAGYVLDSRERLARQRTASAELAGQLASAQLDALRHQVEPHFLFNALNAVSGLVRDGQNERAVETIARVSEFLRHMLQESGQQQVSLEEEMRFATMYLDIQKVRFGDRLRIRIAGVDGTAGMPGLGRAVVPRLILQPLVENAIKHGIGRRVQPGAIEIVACRTDAQLVLTLYNDGPLLREPVDASANAPSVDGTAIGLANVRRRLAGLHGDAASLSVANVEQRGVLVTIALPYREAA